MYLKILFVEIFRTIKSLDNTDFLQSDLYALIKSVDRNNLSLNENKYKLMSFNRSHLIQINNVTLERVFSFKDLGVFLMVNQLLISKFNI